MARTAWTVGFENREEQRQLEIILEVCNLETINSYCSKCGVETSCYSCYIWEGNEK